MKKLFDKIQEYKDDAEYQQVLDTIFNTISPNEYNDFYNMILEAEKTNKKIYIDEDSLKGQMWSTLILSVNVKMK